MNQGGRSNRRTWRTNDGTVTHPWNCHGGHWRCRSSRLRHWSCRNHWLGGCGRLSWFWLGLFCRNLGFRLNGWLGHRRNGFWCFDNGFGLGLRLGNFGLRFHYGLSFRRFLLDLLSGEVILDVLNALSVNVTGG